MKFYSFSIKYYNDGTESIHFLLKIAVSQNSNRNFMCFVNKAKLCLLT